MSLLDMDERLLDLAQQVRIVWGPLVDGKEFPQNVDVTLVEGAVSSEEDLHKIRQIRERTRVLVSLGDCAVTGNVPAMRNRFGAKAVLERAYSPVPTEAVPALLPISRPVHEVVKVDVFVPGCPPSADLIHHVLTELLAGRVPELKAKFG
jgi:NAD-reducing hydrogenase small subunit